MEDIIEKIALEVKNRLAESEAGHDWWHIRCVWKLAKFIAIEEKADLFVTELAALLHDISDYKFNGGDEMGGGITALEILQKFNISDSVMEHVVYIINNISYKGAGVKDELNSLEAKCVQDADRLDALGARGIARAFSYGGYANLEMYNPSIPPILHQSKEDYRKSKGTTINHFYEKLLLLKDRMKTSTGKKLAEERHNFMQIFLAQFLKEWD